MDLAFTPFVAVALGDERFTVVDIGCSGGIDPRWRAFGPRLRALGIDASVTECARLRGLETNPDIEYVATFVGGSADAHIDLVRGQASPLLMKLRDRLSFMRTHEIRQARLAKSAIEEKLRHNAWEMTGLADPCKPAVAADLLAARAWTDVDYLKIDIDGLDYDVLRSFDGTLSKLGMLAVQVEVNFVGTDADTDHTFHNTDRFMRRNGFELFRLEVRTYSSRALPARYVWPTPAETISGRPFQGEAYYALDIDKAGLSAGKLAKLAAILAAWDVPDAAAELLLTHRQTLVGFLDIDKGLDVLAAQAQPGRARKLGYRDYLASFEADRPSFYRPEGDIGMRERLAAAWSSFWNPRP